MMKRSNAGNLSRSILECWRMTSFRSLPRSLRALVLTSLIKPSESRTKIASFIRSSIFLRATGAMSNIPKTRALM